MISAAAHDLIVSGIEYYVHLDEQRQQAYKEFMEYTRKLDEQREYLKQFGADAAQHLPLTMMTTIDLR